MVQEVAPNIAKPLIVQGARVPYIEGMRCASMVVAVWVGLVGSGCPSSSSPNACGEGGREFGDGVATVCAYAVVEGGFLCPPELPDEFEIPGYAGRICAPGGSTPDALPDESCIHLGAPDCDEARPTGGATGDAGPMTMMDAGPPASDGGAPIDAPLPVCDSLEPHSYVGPTAWGAVDAAVVYFASSDCITRTFAFITLRTASGDEIGLDFNYPVMSTPEGRRVPPGPYEETATITWTPASGAADTMTMPIHVEVTRWQENPSDPLGHEIDIAVTVMHSSFDDMQPIVVRGRFCEWPYLLC